MRRLSGALVAISAAAALVVLAVPASAAESRSFSVTPRTVSPGQEVLASGRGCRSRALVRFFLDGNRLDTDTANRRGRFVERVLIPSETPGGRHRLSARCSGRHLGSVQIVVRDTRFTVAPTTVEAGRSVRVSGRGCRPGSLVVIRLDGRRIGTIHANDEGRFSRRVVIPRRTSVGRHVVSATCGRLFVGARSIRVTPPPYPTTADLVTTDRTAIPAGQVVTVSGADCPTGQPTAALDGQPINLNVDHTAKGKGFTGTAAIPTSAVPGKHELSAGCDAGSSGTTELHVLDPETSESAADRQPVGSQRSSDLVMWAGLFAGLALLVASARITRSRRS
jgi:hypothetical protein